MEVSPRYSQLHHPRWTVDYDVLVYLFARVCILAACKQTSDSNLSVPYNHDLQGPMNKDDEPYEQVDPLLCRTDHKFRLD
jgi:hypothetical protein